jgi:hypothetical protein
MGGRSSSTSAQGGSPRHDAPARQPFEGHDTVDEEGDVGAEVTGGKTAAQQWQDGTAIGGAPRGSCTMRGS